MNITIIILLVAIIIFVILIKENYFGSIFFKKNYEESMIKFNQVSNELLKLRDIQK